MSMEAQRVFLTSKVKNLNLGFPVGLPGIPFKKPTNAPYGEFFIMGMKPFIVGGEGKGKVRLRHTGMIQFDVYVPEDKGTKTATMACDKIADTFQLKLGRDNADSLYQFKVAEVMTPRINQNWTVYTVRVPYTRDEIAPVQISLD